MRPARWQSVLESAPRQTPGPWPRVLIGIVAGRRSRHSAEIAGRRAVVSGCYGTGHIEQHQPAVVATRRFRTMGSLLGHHRRHRHRVAADDLTKLVGISDEVETTHHIEARAR